MSGFCTTFTNLRQIWKRQKLIIQVSSFRMSTIFFSIMVYKTTDTISFHEVITVYKLITAKLEMQYPRLKI